MDTPKKKTLTDESWEKITCPPPQGGWKDEEMERLSIGICDRYLEGI